MLCLTANDLLIIFSSSSKNKSSFLSYNKMMITIVNTIFIASNSQRCKRKNCTFCDTSLKFSELIEFDALKKIGLGPQYKRVF